MQLPYITNLIRKSSRELLESGGGKQENQLYLFFLNLSSFFITMATAYNPYAPYNSVYLSNAIETHFSQIRFMLNLCMLSQLL